MLATVPLELRDILEFVKSMPTSSARIAVLFGVVPQ
jgi:hypothetical protein